MKIHFQNIFSKYQSDVGMYSFTFAGDRKSSQVHCIDTREERINMGERTRKGTFKQQKFCSLM